MRKLLTDAFCKAVASPPSGRIEITDLRCAGLAFRITANGTRSWAFRFRDPKTGKSTRDTIGVYPDIGLGDARARADELRKTVAKGSNPVQLKRAGRRAANERSFAAVAERFMVEHSRRFKRSSAGDDLNLNLHILPRWKGRQIEDISRADVIAVAEELVRAGTPVAANRVQSLISSIFSFALDNQLIGANPCSRLKKRGEEGIGTRVLSDDEIRLFWERSVLSPVTRKLGQVRSHGGKVRLSEVLHDRDRNIDKSIWMFRQKAKPSKSGAGHGQEKDAPSAVHVADTASDAVHVKHTPYGVPLTPDLVRELGGVLKSDYPSDPVDVGIECIYVGMEMIESEVRCLRDALARRR